MAFGQGRVRVYGVGAAKTGTHSLGAMFRDRIRAAHEKDAERLIRLHLDRVATGRAGKLRTFLLWRDLRHRLDLDASQVNLYLIDDLLRIWPRSRFVLTYRHPVRWLRSILDDKLRRTTTDTWHEFRDYRFALPGSAPPEEAALAAAGLYTLRGYLGYWNDSIVRAMERVPDEQLLMIPTEEIGTRAKEIAAFCGVPPAPVASGQDHVFANDERFGMLAKVPEAHLSALCHEICGETFSRFFPGRDLSADVAEIRLQDIPDVVAE